MVKIIEKPYIKFYFHHDNNVEEPDGIYGENKTYIIFSPFTVNMVYTIHDENKRNLGEEVYTCAWCVSLD